MIRDQNGVRADSVSQSCTNHERRRFSYQSIGVGFEQRPVGDSGRDSRIQWRRDTMNFVCVPYFARS